nr:MmcQ/YjbR family DNA-binding protein [Granulicella arctica]
MDAERSRTFLLTLPHVVETMQWGDNLVFWTGDKAIGGKMFVLLNLDGDGKAVLSYAAGPERFAELVEIEGVSPAPYFARIYWVAVQRWDVFRPKQWEQELHAAYTLTFDKLPPKTRSALALPAKEQAKLIAERRQQRKAKTEKSKPQES